MRKIAFASGRLVHTWRNHSSAAFNHVALAAALSLLMLCSEQATAQTQIIRAPMAGWTSCTPAGPYESGQATCDAVVAFYRANGTPTMPNLTFVPSSAVGGQCLYPPPQNAAAALPDNILYCPDGFSPQNWNYSRCFTPYHAFRGNQPYCARAVGAIEKGKNLGSCNDGTCGAGNPISPLVGNKYQAENNYANSSSLLRLTRSYNSQVLVGDTSVYEPISGEDWRFGRNWRGNYDTSVVVTEAQAVTSAAVRRADGKVYGFMLSSGAWISDSDITDRLFELTDISGVRTGWQYRVAADDSTETYDAAGKLISIATRTGLLQILTYSSGATPPNVAPRPGLLIGVSDSFGQQLSFTYDALARVSTVVDPAGGTYSYAYDANNNLVSVTYPDSGGSRPHVPVQRTGEHIECESA